MASAWAARIFACFVWMAADDFLVFRRDFDRRMQVLQADGQDLRAQLVPVGRRLDAVPQHLRRLLAAVRHDFVHVRAHEVAHDFARAESSRSVGASSLL